MVISDLAPLFQVFDTRKSVEFYRDGLGFTVEGTYEPDGHLYWVKLKRDSVTLMLNACYEDDKRPDEPDAARTRGHGDTELYLRYDDLDAIYADL